MPVAINKVASVGCFLKVRINDENGFARFHSNLRRCSSANDSGNTNTPYMPLQNAKPAAAINGNFKFKAPKYAPNPTPNINPKADAAPTKPKLAALLSPV